ncbi:anti-sigma B factor RsbW [Cohnella thermotolerans]|jgi:serine/threonine-protein kinase RsbW|uniref:anti-sigma B factor RsbW n=1 Tax=Cohnella thermotolerans TaxID=329858 RepID=UPI0004069F73|nr:anti-sigma B factor RsbW [Cohnella thermotolerans]
MKKEANVTLSVPARPEFVDLVRLTLYGVAVKMSFSYEEIEDMKVAVSEACNNAVLHAYADDEEEGSVDIRFDILDEGELQITVRDSGQSFRPSDHFHSSSLHGKSIEEIQSGGLGLYLMQALMDSVEVRTDQGTAVILTKRRAAAEQV